MDIVVCVKRVPETTEADVVIDKSGRDIDKSGLVFDLNEWDRYAVEEAILLKEKQGGKVTVLTIGEEKSYESLQKCLAMGADDAIRLTDSAFNGSDGYATAKVLAEAIRKIEYNLILTGAQAETTAYGQVEWS
jgi:electron transfer flavoprotein beta subunit